MTRTDRKDGLNTGSGAPAGSQGFVMKCFDNGLPVGRAVSPCRLSLLTSRRIQSYTACTMKKQCAVISFALLVVFTLTPVTGEEEALTNEDIVRLSQAGLGAEVIITKIRASAAAFDTSVAQLLELKGADVEDSVIAAMVDKGAQAPKAAETPAEPEESFIITYPAPGTAAPASGAAPAAPAPVARAPGSSFRDTLSAGGEGPEMVVIPAGRFRMGDLSGAGDDDEKPVHEVVIARPFAMSKYEVTFADYDQFTHPNKVDDRGWGRGRRPVINVSWDDATEYAAWLSAETGKRYRLATEAEWEYAARAGSTTEYSWGNDIGSNRANCDNEDCGDQWVYTAPVGSFSANAWGLHDMHGNVWEWVQDCWNKSYVGAPTDGSAWTSGECGRRVIRGGSWLYNPGNLRSAYRFGNSRSDRDNDIGFRLAQDM